MNNKEKLKQLKDELREKTLELAQLKQRKLEIQSNWVNDKIATSYQERTNLELEIANVFTRVSYLQLEIRKTGQLKEVSPIQRVEYLWCAAKEILEESEQGYLIEKIKERADILSGEQFWVGELPHPKG